MGEKKSIFQIVILGLFAFFIVVGIFMFASLSGGSNGKDIGDVVMWGTYDASLMDSYLRTLNDTDQRAAHIFYEQIPESEFQSRLAEALASGTGPDLFLLSQADVLRDWTKVQALPYDTMSKSAFVNTFIDEGEMFLGQDGIAALPFSIDPIVLYWNRDIFAESGFANPPTYWDELFGLAEKITQRDKANNIIRATIAFGEFDNVDHAKDILSTLILQAGGDIVNRDAQGVLYTALVPEAALSGEAVSAAQTALRFYTEFADPVKNVYTWNRSMPRSLDAFAQGRLAMYVGYASEARLLQEKNAHLNYSVAPIPQIRSSDTRKVVTFGTMHALAIPRAAQNAYGAQQMALVLSDGPASQLFSEVSNIPSPRRDVLATDPQDPALLIFRNAALISRAWYDPDSQASTSIFRKMVGDVTSGALRLSDSVARAQQEFAVLIKSQ